jgi:hypothetical protein
MKLWRLGVDAEAGAVDGDDDVVGRRGFVGDS